MAKPESNDRDLQDIWDESRLDSVPFWGSANELLEYGNILDKCLERVRNSQSARDIVIEAWLTLDYSIRTLVLAAFELTDYDDQDFDLRTKLLPVSKTELQVDIASAGFHVRIPFQIADVNSAIQFYST